MSRRHRRRVTMRHRTITLRNGSTLRWTEYPYGNRHEYEGAPMSKAVRYELDALIERLQNRLADEHIDGALFQ